MNHKEITKAIKATVNASTVLPILEDVFLTGSELHVTDLETRLIIPFNSGIHACVPANKFLDALGMMEQPQFLLEHETAVTVSEGKRSIKLSGDKVEEFPKCPDYKSWDHVGFLAEEAMCAIQTALKFVTKDDLRPAMTGVYIGKDIAATDAHRLYWQPLNEVTYIPVERSFILPAKTARILLTVGGAWHIDGDDKGNVSFINEDNVVVICRTIDAKYPEYTVVIPDVKDSVADLVVDVKSLRNEIKNALKFANASTHQVVLDLNGSVNIQSQDVDFAFEYKNELEVKSRNGELKWGCNGKFLDDTLANLNSDVASIKFLGSQKAAVINDHFLLMPLMLHE